MFLVFSFSTIFSEVFSCWTLEVTDQFLQLRSELTARGLVLPVEQKILLKSPTAIEEIKSLLDDFRKALDKWEEVDLGLRRAYPILNLFTHSNLRELTKPGLPHGDLVTLLTNAKFTEQEIERIERKLQHPATLDTAVQWFQKFSLRSIPMVQREAEALYRCAGALPSTLPRGTRSTPPMYLKQGSPNLLLLPESKVLPSILSMFLDVHGAMPNASQVLVCAGLEETVAPEQLRLFLLRCLLSGDNSLHVVLLPESLSYQNQKYFLSTWRSLVQFLGASAGQKKYLLTLVSLTSSKDSLLFDAFRAYQQDPPQLRTADLRQHLGQDSIIVWSRTPCAGKTSWIEQDLERHYIQHTSLMLNEKTRGADIIAKLRESGRGGSAGLVLCPSPLVQSLDVDLLLFRLLILRQIPQTDGKPFLCHVRRLYLEVPNVLDGESLLDQLGFSLLMQRHEAQLEQMWDLNVGNMQRACQILRARRHGALFDNRMMRSMVSREACQHLLEENGPSTANGAAEDSVYCRLVGFCGNVSQKMSEDMCETSSTKWIFKDSRV